MVYRQSAQRRICKRFSRFPMCHVCQFIHNVLNNCVCRSEGFWRKTRSEGEYKRGSSTGKFCDGNWCVALEIGRTHDTQSVFNVMSYVTPRGIDWIQVSLDAVIIAGSLYLASVPLDRRRLRASWATRMFVIGGIVGIVGHIPSLLLETHLVTFGRGDNSGASVIIEFADGFLLGCLLALIMSGQLRGANRDGKETSHEMAP
jgi:hypothetical protein